MTRICVFIIFLFLFGCSGTSSNLKIQIVRHSSEILKCDKIFAENLKRIEERNEILLQTGSIDTTDEHSPSKSAIVTIDKTEIILILITANTENNETTEKYKGNGYTLTLTYQTMTGQYSKTTYSGKFILENNNSKKELRVEGKKCTL